MTVIRLYKTVYLHNRISDGASVMGQDLTFTLSGASLWGPLKELWETVDGAVLRRQPESVHLLDLQLKKHKAHFLSLFRNPVGYSSCADWHIIAAQFVFLD